MEQILCVAKDQCCPASDSGPAPCSPPGGAFGRTGEIHAVPARPPACCPASTAPLGLPWRDHGLCLSPSWRDVLWNFKKTKLKNEKEKENIPPAPANPSVAGSWLVAAGAGSGPCSPCVCGGGVGGSAVWCIKDK